MRNGAEQWGLLKAKSLRDNQIVKRGGVSCSKHSTD